MVAPGGQFRTNEVPIPMRVNTIPNKVAKLIIFANFCEKVFAIAAGRDRIAMTKMTPTTWMRRTTVIATRERSKK